MATTRSRRLKESAPVEKKPVDAPKAKEVKEVSKPVEKKVEPPKEVKEAPKPKEVKEAPKPAAKKVEKPLPKIIEKHSKVSGKRGVGHVIRIAKSEEDASHDLITVKTESGEYRAHRSDLVLV